MELILHLLTNEQLLDLFEKVTCERVTITWPIRPEEERKQQQLNLIRALILNIGYDRGLANDLQERAIQSRLKLESITRKTGGILPPEDA
jgi:hypothetical protein